MTRTEHSSSLRRLFQGSAGRHTTGAYCVYDVIHGARASEIIEFLASPVAATLKGTGQVVPAETLRCDESGLRVYHLPASFVSYPWEWPSGLWLRAAELTLDICSQLLTEGWVLNGATPLNITFDGITPKLANILCVEKLAAGRPFWPAYMQFVRTFLLRMLAHSQLGRQLQTTGLVGDRFDADEVYDALSRMGRLKSFSMGAVTTALLLARMMEERVSAEGTTVPRARKAEGSGDLGQVTKLVRKRLCDLRKAMRRAMPAQRTSLYSRIVRMRLWFDAGKEARKLSLVAEILQAYAPRHVLDVGCGTGAYSRLAALAGAKVVAIDTDTKALDRLFAELQRSGLDVLPLCVDLADSAPTDGWDSPDRLSFVSRCEGRFDTVMMHAGSDQRRLESQIPSGYLAFQCSLLTTCNFIFEWATPSVLNITEDVLRETFAPYFRILRETRFAEGGILFHMVKR